PAIEAIGGFGIDRIGVQNQAAKRHLDVAAWAAEPVIQIEVAKGRVQIVAPKQTDDPPAKPYAFWIACRPVQGALRLSKFIDFLRFLGAVLGGVLGAIFGALFGCRGLRVGRFGVFFWSESGKNFAPNGGRCEP